MEDGRSWLGLKKYSVDVLNQDYVLWNIICLIIGFLSYMSIKNNIYVTYFEKYNINYMLKFLNNLSVFKLNFLNDMTAVDYPGNNKRFKIVYVFSNEIFNIKFSFLFFTKMFKKVCSMSLFVFSSKWAEREAWDMFGVKFFNHDDLRRILTDYNFKGHPLRKDYPLSGFYEISYFEEFATILYKKIELMQELRFYNFFNAWEEWDEI